MAKWLTTVGLLGALAAGTVRADSPPPTADDVLALMKTRPPTAKVWPAWRDYYVRLYWAYEVGEPNEFYDQLDAFIGGVAAQNQGNLPGDWASDPVAWIVLSGHFLRSDPDGTAQAEAASRKAMALGDPVGMSSFALARALVAVAQRGGEPGRVDADVRRKLREAEDLLDAVRHKAPQARLSFVRGMVAWQRGEAAQAMPLLRQGALDHPKQSQCAATFLALWFSSKQPTKPFAGTTGPFAKMFPDDAHIQALHALALLGDERFREAWETWHQARQHDGAVGGFLGADTAKALEESRWMTPRVIEGRKLTANGSHPSARVAFQRALEEEPDNVVAARLLTKSLLNHAGTGRDSPKVAEVLDTCRELCRRFPQDPDLHVACAAALFRNGRNIEANDALQRAKDLGGNLDRLAGPDAETTIREAAQRQAAERLLWSSLVGGAAGLTAWIPIMFLLGVLLAVCIPRKPSSNIVLQEDNREGVWLERFYLLVLSLSLLMFYLSVPFVALGLLAITLALFVLMLVVRIIHVGILYRGFFATWGVIRAAFLGPSRDVLGLVTAQDEQPQLFATLGEVAQRLNTTPVATVYLTPRSQISVREEGRGPFGLFRRRRVMEIGIPTFSLVTMSEFKSILAHEYGHFTHQDTFYSRFIFQVSNSLAYSLAVMNAAAGGANYVNPFYWFYWLYLRAYAVLAAGFSRSCEFLADRRALLAYGKGAFISGMTKVSVDGAMFEASAIQSIRKEMGAGRAYVNVFETFRQFRDQTDLADAQREVLDGLRAVKPGWFDSHPTFSERIAVADCYPESAAPPDSGAATGLLSNVSGIEEQLTNLLTDYLANQGG
jgi:Zn-dependent protease with chaperone function